MSTLELIKTAASLGEKIGIAKCNLATIDREMRSSGRFESPGHPNDVFVRRVRVYRRHAALRKQLAELRKTEGAQ